MAAGLPIVAPDIGDIARMVSPANLPFITHANAVSLRDALQSLAAAEPAARAHLGAQNRLRAVQEYDESVMIARYVALYEEAMGRPGGASLSQFSR